MHESFLGFLRTGPFANAAARDAVGTRCHLAERGWIRQLCENTVTVCAVFSASRHSARLNFPI